MLVALFRLLARLPLSWLHGTGAALGWLVYWSSPAYSSRLRENLYSSGVCASEAQYAPLLRAAVAAAGKGVIELIAVWFGDDEKVARLVVECSRWDVVESARARGDGIIFLTPHLGCFEVNGHYLAQRLQLTALYRPPRQPWLERLMLAGRNQGGARLSPANLRGVRTLYKALQRGEAVGLLPDQAPQVGEGAWANFFGRPAYTMTLVRRLQKQSGAAVIFGFAERLPKGAGYKLELERYEGGELDERRLNACVEDLVRRCPTQYLWSYNRYKVPAGVEKPVVEAHT